MFEELLVHHIWLAITLCGGTYTSDYFLTLYAARLYQAKAMAQISFGGSLELTPAYQADIDQLRHWSPRFAFAMLVIVAGVALTWWVSVRVLEAPALFLFFVGALLLREVPIHIRHVRNILLFRAVRDTESVKGRIEYARWLTLRLSAVELLAFALLFLAGGLLMTSWLLWGGALGCAVIAYQHQRLARAASKPA